MHINVSVVTQDFPFVFVHFLFIFEMHQVKDLCYYWIGFDYVFVHPFSSVFFLSLFYSFSSLRIHSSIFGFNVVVRWGASKHTECFICCYCCCSWCVLDSCFDSFQNDVYTTYLPFYICIDKMMIVPKIKLKSGQYLWGNVLSMYKIECGQNAIEIHANAR